jgi:hypothetical protein
VIRATNGAVPPAALGLLLIVQVYVADLLIIAWLALLVVGGRSAVRVGSARHRRRTAEE